MLYDDIKKDNFKAIKARDTDAKNAYGAILSAADYAIVDCRTKGQPFTDVEMYKVIGKVLKELDEELDTYVQGDRPEQAKAIRRQIEVVSQYKPVLMSEDDIKKIVSALPDKSIKAVMGEFKTKYAGKADMGLVAKVAKSFQAK